MERTDLPIEAAKINGQYIEDMLSGYTTIKTSGREALTPELSTYSVGSSSGERVKSIRYPARIITVEFALKGDSLEDLRDKLEHLNNLLSMDEADFVFNDESDRFYTGTPMLQTDFSDYKNSCRGSYQVYCADPFKYSVEPIVQEPVSVNDYDASFIFNYHGTYPAKPILQVEFAGALSGGDYSEDGDCGFVAFMDEDENIIQMGNPDAVDLSGYTSAAQLENREFTTVAGWNQSGGKAYGNKAITGSVASANFSDTYWNKGKGQTIKCAKPSYGSGSGWHGPILRKTTEDAVNFNIAIVHRMCCKEAKQLGSFECGYYSTAGSTILMVAGFVIEKSAAGSSATVRYIVNGKSVGTDTIDLSYYNTNFGYCNRTAVYKTKYYNKKKKKWQDKKIKGAKTKKVNSGYTFTQSNLNSSIRKAGAQVTFKVGELAARTITEAGIEYIAANCISFHFGQNGTNAALHTNAVNSVRITRNASPSFADTPNVFTSGDIVEADCNDASIYIKHANTEEGHLEPQYGALGNNWEGFSLEQGQNVISCVWSDWTKPAYKPTPRIIYNEVFL